MVTEFVLLCMLVAVIAYLLGQRQLKGFPPGPWGLPFLGALPLLGNYSHKTAVAWKSKYGPVLGLDFVGRRCVIVSDFELMKEAANDPAFAGRANLPFMKDRSGGETEGIIFTSGRKWVEQRRFTLRKLRDFGFGTRSMESIVLDEVLELIERFKQETGKPISTANRFNVAIINALWTIIAGERFQQDDPQLNKIFEMVTQDLRNMSFLSMLSAFVPWFGRYVPDWITGYSRIMGPVGPMTSFIRPYIDSHFASHIQGQPRDFMDAYIDEMKETEDTSSSFHISKSRSLMYTVLDLFMAGGETTSTTLSWIFLFMARHPHVQEKLHAEIDRVIGNSRLPTLADRAEMPYAEAVIHEVLRTRTFVSMTMHCTTEDVQLHEYRIPKDTMVMLNLYAANNDPALWGDPDNFRPERFLSKDGKQFERRDGLVSFSVGKRVCLGERLARDELFLFTVALFQAFEVGTDPNGSPPSLESVAIGITLPQPHKLVLTSRV